MNLTTIILDRDGVINQDSTEYIKSIAEWHPIEGSINAIASLSQAGYRIFLATNQAGIARGKLTEESLEAIHHKLKNAVSTAGGKIEAIIYCPHHPDDHCACRKPKPGMLHQIATEYDVDMTSSVFIGDSVKDVEAAIAAGCQPILVRTGNGEETELTLSKLAINPPPIFKDLAAYSASVLN